MKKLSILMLLALILTAVVTGCNPAAEMVKMIPAEELAVSEVNSEDTPQLSDDSETSKGATSSQMLFQSYNYPDYYIRPHINGSSISNAGYSYDTMKFVQVPSLIGVSGYISLCPVNYPGYYLRHQNGIIKMAKNDGTTTFRKDASFKMVPGLADSSCKSFESYNYPGAYIRHSNYRLYIHYINGSLAQQDATFRIQSLNPSSFQSKVDAYKSATDPITSNILSGPVINGGALGKVSNSEIDTVNFRIGEGIDLLSGKYKNMALDPASFTIIESPLNYEHTTYEEVSSFESVRKFLNMEISANASATYAGKSGSYSGKYNLIKDMQSEQSAYHVICKIDFEKKALYASSSGIKLGLAPVENYLRTGNSAGFRKEYGDHYVDEVTLGGQLFIKFTFTSSETTTYTSEEISHAAKWKAEKVAKGDFNYSTDKMKKEIMEKFNLKITSYKVGGPHGAGITISENEVKSNINNFRSEIGNSNYWVAIDTKTEQYPIPFMMDQYNYFNTFYNYLPYTQRLTDWIKYENQLSDLNDYFSNVGAVSSEMTIANQNIGFMTQQNTINNCPDYSSSKLDSVLATIIGTFKYSANLSSGIGWSLGEKKSGEELGWPFNTNDLDTRRVLEIRMNFPGIKYQVEESYRYTDWGYTYHANRVLAPVSSGTITGWTKSGDRMVKIRVMHESPYFTVTYRVYRAGFWNWTPGISSDWDWMGGSEYQYNIHALQVRIDPNTSFINGL